MRARGSNAGFLTVEYMGKREQLPASSKGSQISPRLAEVVVKQLDPRWARQGATAALLQAAGYSTDVAVQTEFTGDLPAHLSCWSHHLGRSFFFFFFFFGGQGGSTSFRPFFAEAAQVHSVSGSSHQHLSFTQLAKKHEQRTAREADTSSKQARRLATRVKRKASKRQSQQRKQQQQPPPAPQHPPMEHADPTLPDEEEPLLEAVFFFFFFFFWVVARRRVRLPSGVLFLGEKFDVSLVDLANVFDSVTCKHPDLTTVVFVRPFFDCGAQQLGNTRSNGASRAVGHRWHDSEILFFFFFFFFWVTGEMSIPLWQEAFKDARRT
ncbi:hypothetical protein ABBQ38_001298 [Trebouxia sp. C0009 RCD-2024]